MTESSVTPPRLRDGQWNELDPAGFQIAQGLIDGKGFTGDVSRDGTQQIRLDAMRLQSLQRITYPQIEPCPPRSRRQASCKQPLPSRLRPTSNVLC